MNVRAEKAFIALPNAIDQIDTGIIYSHDDSTTKDPTFWMLKVDLTYLLHYYVNDMCFFTVDTFESLIKLLHSSDKGDWLIAFMSIDAQKHKLWQDTDQNNQNVYPKTVSSISLSTIN